MIELEKKKSFSDKLFLQDSSVSSLPLDSSIKNVEKTFFDSNILLRL